MTSIKTASNVSLPKQIPDSSYPPIVINNVTYKINLVDFETLFPWLCVQFEIPLWIKVVRKSHERLSLQSQILNKRRTKQFPEINLPVMSQKVTQDDYECMEDELILALYYDSKNILVHVEIKNKCAVQVPPELIKIFGICTTFYPSLVKMSIRNGLNKSSLHEISNLVRQSYFTEICLDDTYVPEGNYFELLEGPSRVKCLWLNRCRLGDTVCVEIAKRLGSPSQIPLVLLEMCSNLITDAGAKALGNALRINRRLRHLNLTDNKITNKGAQYLVDSLKMFPLNSKETKEIMLQRLEYYKDQEKAKVSKEQISDRKFKNSNSLISVSNRKLKKSSTKSFEKVDSKYRASSENKEKSRKKKSAEIEKEILEPFNYANIIIENDIYYCAGNFVLCSLILAYNKLDYLSLKSFTSLVEYQQKIRSSRQIQGIIKMNLDGNKIPQGCPEYENIESYFESTLAVAYGAQIRNKSKENYKKVVVDNKEYSRN